jgi:broad specificity phosphatase PhoE
MIVITRHGESQDNTTGKLGGNSDLTALGRVYSLTLGHYIRNIVPDGSSLRLCTSAMLRTQQTGALAFPELGADRVVVYPELNELCAGDFEQLTYADIEHQHPDEFTMRQQNKFNYVYPGAGGESYEVLFRRVRPIIESIIKSVQISGDTVVVVAHQAVCRMIMAVVLCANPEKFVRSTIPLHTALQFNAELQKFQGVCLCA